MTIKAPNLTLPACALSCGLTCKRSFKRAQRSNHVPTVKQRHTAPWLQSIGICPDASCTLCHTLCLHTESPLICTETSQNLWRVTSICQSAAVQGLHSKK